MRAELPETFRDPAGYVEFTESAVLRHVHPEYVECTRKFISSLFFQRSQACSHIVATEALIAGGNLLLRHPRIFFPSYPWEWAPAQWRAASLLTLQLCEDAITSGYLLKDATPLNVLFEGSKPIFVDLLSFEERSSEESLWLAQAQFVRTFLLPLLARRYLGWPLSATQIRRDGYEPQELYECISTLKKLDPRLFWFVTLPTWLERRAEKRTPSAPVQLRRSPEMATHILQKNIQRLRKQVERATPPVRPSHWGSYTVTAKHYSPQDLATKQAFVFQVLKEVRPETVLDIGANTGTYALLAAKQGARVVALDKDTTAVDQIWRRASAENQDVQPIIADIARPTPAIGWGNAESLSLMDRMENKFDLVLALAIIHHLLLMDQVPLDHIAFLLAKLARRYVLLEWVPQKDPMFQLLLRGRGRLYQHLRLDTMLASFAAHFQVSRRQDLSNGRILLFLEKR